MLFWFRQSIICQSWAGCEREHRKVRGREAPSYANTQCGAWPYPIMQHRVVATTSENSPVPMYSWCRLYLGKVSQAVNWLCFCWWLVALPWYVCVVYSYIGIFQVCRAMYLVFAPAFFAPPLIAVCIELTGFPSLHL